MPEAKLTETHRISGGLQPFSYISAITISKSGRIAIAQSLQGRASVFDSTHRYAHDAGGLGSGPTELRNVGAAGWSGDTLWLVDNLSPRILFFRPDGKPAGLWAASRFSISPKLGPLSTDGVAYSPVAVLADGGMLARRRELPAPGVPISSSAPTTIVRISSRSEVIGIPMRHAESLAALTVKRFGGGLATASVPFLPPVVDVVAPDGNRIGYVEPVMTDSTAAARVVIVRANGDTVLSAVIPFRAVPLAASARDSALAATVDRLVNPVAVGPNGPIPGVRFPPVDTADLRRAERDMRERMPVLQPPYIGARIGMDNTIWIHMRNDGEQAEWMMLSEKGTPELTLRLPPKTRLLQASRTVVWAGQTAPDNTQSAVRFSISR